MSRKRIATAADLRALNRNAGPVSLRFPADGSRARLTIPSPPRSKRGKR